MSRPWWGVGGYSEGQRMRFLDRLSRTLKCFIYLFPMIKSYYPKFRTIKGQLHIRRPSMFRCSRIYCVAWLWVWLSYPWISIEYGNFRIRNPNDSASYIARGRFKKRYPFAPISIRPLVLIPHPPILKEVGTKNWLPPIKLERLSPNRSHLCKPRKESWTRPLRFPYNSVLNQSTL